MACPVCGAALSDGSSRACAACLLAIALDSGPSELPTMTAIGTVSDHPAVLPRLTPGARFGPYRIERLLGTGGMGEVYEAEHTEQGRRLALKVVSGRLTDHADRSRFLREGQLAASVNHPNSVYIFGAEEIHGLPVIAMELLGGGTLKDRVEGAGPMEPGMAVDAILQVIAGLDAAHQAGVLHRDIKPSNCFVGTDGTVKVGDFGLSISTLARRPDALTESGVVRGTPQFAAPEQLKGQPLDVRSDIYAVGATLHYLLTGQAPFDAETVSALIARVVSEPAPSARTLRPDVPKGLDRILMRCLAKEPSSRPPDYAALHHALRPFSTEASVPATPAVRFAAGALDYVVLWPLSGAAALGIYATSPGSQAWAFAGSVAYFSLLEGVWGTSVGKWLCGLRVARAGRPGSVGVRRALVRAVFFTFVWHTAGVAVGVLDRADGSAAVAFGRTVGLLLPCLLLALLFSTARRRNGFASVYDLLTSTSVVLREVRPGAPVVDAYVPPRPAGDMRAFGPYRVRAELGPVCPGRLFLAHDDALKRDVWIHATAGEPAVSSSRRRLARTTRLRWLTGERTGHDGWDAYEAADGAALGHPAVSPQPWRLVKRWMGEVAREIELGAADGTVPCLSLDRVWITRRGQAVLLDWTVVPPGMAQVQPDLPGAQRFLRHLAGAALMGWSDASAPLERPLPLHVRTMLASLADARFESFTSLRVALEGLVHQPDVVSRRRRAASCLLPAVPVLVGMALVTLLIGRFSTAAGSTLSPTDLTRLFVLQATVIAVLAAMTTYLTRGGAVLRWWGIGVATVTGGDPSRARVVWRTVVAWAPVLACSALVLAADLRPRQALVAAVLSALVWLLGAVYAVLNPERGIQDRAAWTWLVPR